MWASGAVQEHRISAGHGHVECAHVRLPIDKGDMATVNSAVHGSACRVGGGLSYSVVAIAELKLYNIANCCDNRVWNECILWSSDDDGDYLVGATEWLGSDDWEFISVPKTRWLWEGTRSSS